MTTDRTRRVWAVVGSRDFPNLALVRDFVRVAPRDVVILSGGARGVDKTAYECALGYGLEAREIPADWETFGKKAGFIRNAEIVKEADVVFAFWDGQSRGTKHTIDLAVRKGKEVHVFGKENRSYEAEVSA